MLQLATGSLVALLALGCCTQAALWSPHIESTTTTTTATASPATMSPWPSLLSNASDRLAEFRCTQRSCGGRYNPELYRQIRWLSTNFKGLFMTRCEIFKVNWCRANRGRCPEGHFPTHGPEAYLLRKNCDTYNAQLPPEVTTLEPHFVPTSGFDFEQTSNMSTNENRRLKRMLNDAPAMPASAHVRGDLDRCCQTKSELRIMAGLMFDYRNQPCFVVSLNDRLYQLADVGLCYEDSKGWCDGECKQESRLVTLLCLEPVPGLSRRVRATFRLFYVDAYCSCRYSTTGR